ncbi:MAG TPA: phosphoribosylformylglycinamidine synthase subunit PurQ [Armatimonadota bacterium]|nr:phosphoribosylformylglycinamidine synthase subunit PurQ [Armatimonadota bacterium]HPP73630.1 phosphoribosylformylglycinamidine synthase subunit PurQ [Armatimonadota bacterium]
MKFGVIVFPGSNCDQDAYYAVRDVLKEPVEYIWHQEHDLKGVDCVIVPGGFSYGDYLRTGAVARFSPVMEAVKEHTDKGGYAIGICNGFQILCEAHLLPGALVSNDCLKFVCKYVQLTPANLNTPWTNQCKNGQVLNIPIAHQGGNFVCDQETLKRIEDNGQVILRYCDEAGRVTPEANPNGSLNNIAGVINERGNVAGMMPHPERAVEKILGSADGLNILRSVIEWARR